MAIDDEYVDTDEEQEKQEEEKEKSTSTVKFAGQLPHSLRAVVIVTPGNAHALIKIIFDAKLVEIGKGESTYKDKTIDTLKIYHVADYNLLIVVQEPGLKASFSN